MSGHKKTHAESDAPRRAEPRIDPATGLIEPTVEDLVFMAMHTPGIEGSTGLNVLVWGDPGGGKTSLIKDAIKWSGKNPYYIDLSLEAPEDLGGLPRVSFAELSADGRDIKIFLNAEDRPVQKQADGTFEKAAKVVALSIKAPDITWLRLTGDPKAVLVVDDLTNAMQAVQAALLRVALSREISDGTGGFISIKHMPIISAANHGRGNSLQPLLGPLANRFLHIFWAQDPDGLAWWNSGQASQLTLDMEKVKSIPQWYARREEKFRRIVIEYVVSKQIKAFDVPAPDDFQEVTQHAYASNRTYEFMWRALAACEHFGLKPDRMIKGSIGADKGAEFLKWMKERELVEQAYAGKINWKGLTPDLQRKVSLEAATKFRNPGRQAAVVYDGDEQLSGLLKSLDSLKATSSASEDISRFAREDLVRRTKEAMATPADKATAKTLNAKQVAMVQAAWPAAFPELRPKAGPDQELAA